MALWDRATLADQGFLLSLFLSRIFILAPAALFFAVRDVVLTRLHQHFLCLVDGCLLT